MNYNVPNDYQIMTPKLSTKKTINNYNKDEALQSLFNSLKEGLIKDANYWGAEILASGFHGQLWDGILSFYFKNINYVNPQLLNYVNQQYLLYCEIKKLYTGNLKNLCNNQELRNHLSETITTLCISKKETITIPKEETNSPIDGLILDKTCKFVSIFVKNISTNSTLYQYFFQFVANYYNNSINNCLYYLDWFVKDNEYMIDVNLEFKIPAILSKKSILLILKFLILQIKAQIKVHKKTNKLDEITDILDTALSFYILIYKKKDYETCSYIVIYILVLSRCLDHYDQEISTDSSDPRLIQMCMEINFIYQNIQQKQLESKKKETKNKTKSKSAGRGKNTTKTQTKEQFYENPMNQQYLKLLYDRESLLQNAATREQQNDKNQAEVITYNPKNKEDDGEDGDDEDEDDDDGYDEEVITISGTNEKNDKPSNININVELCE